MPQRWRISQFLLGVEGMALLRRWVTGDPRAIEPRVQEIEDLCRRFRAAPADDVIEVEEVDVVTGYAALAKTYDHIGNPLVVAEGDVVRSLLQGLPKGRVLDAACGTGRHSEHLVALGHDVTAIDVSPAMLEQARAKVPAARFLQGDLRALPLAPDTQDAAVCGLALSHLSELSPAVSELARVVRRGGDLILSDIHPFAAATGAHVAIGTEEGSYRLVRNEFHPHSRYLEAFARCGLEVLACVEPRFDAARYGREGPLGSVRDATAMALDGLPFALIWHLGA